MAQQQDSGQLDALFEKLQACIKNQQHKKALKAADEVLALAPKDEDALRCKLVANLQLGEFEAALELLTKPPLSNLDLHFEKAYCLYRLGRIEEALAVTQSLPAGQEACPGLQQLQAQLHYRLGGASECIRIYEQLFQVQKLDSVELKANVLAAYVAAGLAHELPAITAAMKLSSKASFEVAFNLACGRVETGPLAQAESELRLAIKQGREVLFEEDLGEEEVEEELAPLSTQLAYVLGRLGRAAEAGETYDKLIRGEVALCDDATKAIATNNAIADASHRIEPGPQHRKFVASCTKKLEGLLEEQWRGGAVSATKLPKFLPDLDTRLSGGQKRALLLNLGLLYLVAGRPEPARDLASAIIGALGAAGAGPQPVLLLAAALVALGKTVEADRQLDAYSAANPGAALLPTLMRAQLALDAGKNEPALGLLSSIPDSHVALSGGVLVTRVALHETLGDATGAESVLEAALSSWRSQQQRQQGSEAAAQGLGYCLSSLVGLKLKLGKVPEATALFQQLLKDAPALSRNASGTGVLARLARALAATSQDASAAPKLVAQAGVPAADSRGLDVDALEDFTRMGGAKARAPPVPASALAGGEEGGEGGKEGRKRAAGGEAEGQEKKKSKRKRKPRYPKGYDPSLPGGGLPPPDPERWLPKWERSDYKKKRAGKKAREMVKGSQGAGKVDLNLDKTGATASAPAATAAAAPAKGPALPARKGGKGRK